MYKQTYKIHPKGCLHLFPEIPDKSVDMILTDLPYGTTKNNWDIPIDLSQLWIQYDRILKGNGAVLLFGQNRFTATLINSNLKMYRYTLVWDKKLISGFLNANRMPLRQHEDILIFYKKLPTYNPQKTKGKKNHKKGKEKESFTNNVYGNFESVDNSEKLGDEKYPTSVLPFRKDHPSISIHPTQKPLALIEYLIKTYTNEEDTVHDSCMGSGVTLKACKNLNRNFIGFEISDEWEKHYEV